MSLHREIAALEREHASLESQIRAARLGATLDAIAARQGLVGANLGHKRCLLGFAARGTSASPPVPLNTDESRMWSSAPHECPCGGEIRSDDHWVSTAPRQVQRKEGQGVTQTFVGSRLADAQCQPMAADRTPRVARRVLVRLW